MIFKLTQEEKDSGIIAPDTLSNIVENIRTIGYAVVADLISKETCELLAASVQEDVEKVRETGKATLHEKYTGQGHLQLGLRRYAPYVTTDLVANPLIECIVAGVLGKGAWLGFYNGNVNCPGSTHQPLHFDRPFTWKSEEEATKAGQSWPPPPTTLGCSFALEEITEANGATEIYPKTHLETEVTKWALGERIEDHSELMEQWGPAGHMPIPSGGICFRDPRMWHRGVPNPSDRARAMIAATYHSALGRHWRGTLVKDMTPEDIQRCEEDSTLRVLDNGELGDGRLIFQGDTREVFESSRNLHGINRNARFVDKPLTVNHLVKAHNMGGASIVESDVITADESQVVLN